MAARSRRRIGRQITSRSRSAELDSGEVVAWGAVPIDQSACVDCWRKWLRENLRASRLSSNSLACSCPRSCSTTDKVSRRECLGALPWLVRTLEFDLTRNGIALNPLQIFPVDTHGPATVAQRVADTFLRVYPRLGVQQHCCAAPSRSRCLVRRGIVTADSRTWTTAPPAFRDVEQKLLVTERTRTAYAESRGICRIPHFDSLLFRHVPKDRSGLSWSDLLADHSHVWILQLGGLEASVERAVTEFLLWSLIRYFEVLVRAPTNVRRSG